MNPQLKKIAVPVLRWAVGLVILFESLQLAFGAAAIHRFARTGLPAWLRPTLAWTEIFAAVLFLLPVTTVAGSYFLLMVLGFAALLHILHGEYNIGALIVYATAVLVSLAHRNNATTRNTP